MNSQQCLAGASAVQEEGTPHLLLCSVQIFVSWMGKVRVINPMKLFQLEGGGKIVSKCFCFKGTTDFPSPRISSVWMLSAAAHNWKKQPFKMTLLRIWVSWILTGSFPTSLVSQLIPSPVSEAPSPPCLNVLQLLSHGRAQLPGSRPPARVWALTTHTPPESSPDTPAPTSPALRCGHRGLQYPSSPQTKQTMAIQQPPDSPKLQKLMLLLPVCQQKANSLQV